MLTGVVDEIRALTPVERIERLHAVDAELRRLEAEAAVLVARIGDDRAFRSRGHLTISGFLRGELRWSPQQVTARRRLGHLVDRVPAVIEHLADGTIGVAQAHAFGRAAAANPRCGDQLGDCVDVLLEHARVLPYQDFMVSLNRWEQLADSDGAHRDAAANHHNRRLAVSFHDGVGYIDGRCGGLDFAAFSEIFEQYRHAEFLADWHDAVARYGEADAGMHLTRTDAQRSWDAMMRMATDAVSTPPGAQAPEPVVNLVCGLETVEDFLADAGLIPDRDDTALASEPTPGDDRCETTNGIPVTPADVVQAMIHGRVRRVVFDSAGVVIDAGRLRRLFDGAMRDLMRLHSPTCIFPGCNRPATWCQIDHLTDWQYGGTTSAANAGPMCARHNQLKNSGFTVWRDPNGVFHTYHPDGTEIAPPPPPPGAAPPTWPHAA